MAGKVVLVAGGTGGLGRAVSLAFVEAGARVIVTFRRPGDLDELKKAASAKLVAADGASLEGFAVDATDEAAVAKLIDGIVERHGRMDCLVNAVGGYAGGIKLWEMETKVFEQQLAVNLRAGFVLTRAAARVMVKQGSGAIVNVASKAAVDHAAGASAYAASKAAAVAMIDCLAADLQGTGVRANSILPSIIDTPANRKAMPKAKFAAWPKPEEIARVILFLCSDEAKLIQGASVPVYGDT
ncbi:MAG TPA: SDR family NAD(P)-dependent oxidoreductase [Candidatus Binatus sp.]|jgi:NAD(P)-dependent dehydrogenase (short-subunit alcohol dehydrogenase family)|nr:SDR family NAD(P)-dependent oxidoreductase [Candidatus Binatus sp.]